MSKRGGHASLATADIHLFESDGYLSDATITCGDRTWNVHKVILGSRCEWFRAAFHGNMKEGISGDIVLEEQDPKLVDMMLRFIYAKDIDIAKLSNGKRTKAVDALECHCDNTLYPSDAETCKDQSPPWLTEVINAVEEAYKDSSTADISEILVESVWDNSYKIFKFSDAVDLLDKIPELVRDIQSSYSFRKIPEHKAIRSRGGLEVLSAVQCPGNFLELGDGQAFMWPAHPFHFTDLDEVFMTVNPQTDLVMANLAWMAPSARIVKTVTGHRNSSVVQLRTQVEPGRPQVLYICFRSILEAELCVERYCRVKSQYPSLVGAVLWHPVARHAASV